MNYSVVPQNDRLQRYTIIDSDNCPGKGKRVVAQNIRSYDEAYNLASSANDGVVAQRDQLLASLKYMLKNIGNGRAIETRDGYDAAKALVERIESSEVQP